MPSGKIKKDVGCCNGKIMTTGRALWSQWSLNREFMAFNAIYLHVQFIAAILSSSLFASSSTSSVRSLFLSLSLLMPFLFYFHSIVLALSLIDTENDSHHIMRRIYSPLRKSVLPINCHFIMQQQHRNERKSGREIGKKTILLSKWLFQWLHSSKQKRCHRIVALIMWSEATRIVGMWKWLFFPIIRTMHISHGNIPLQYILHIVVHII